ncbi:MAG: hypothetical protein CVU56_22900 [Deltaproteobacteria bacterium HGW-Deltaproteobacteria-14]|jgi:hypothetical protein|nr:MAG: hypothetical protein CVU56_22900 [Deltaproteobacteria bacterium HGW-Deltaproteobacteria-14]
MLALKMVMALAMVAVVSGGMAAPTAARAPGSAASVNAVVNGVSLSPAELSALARRGIVVRPGSYWYDARCGAWGYLGRGAAGVLPAGLPVRGRMWRGISGGRSGVVVNGRELTSGEVRELARLGSVRRGRYWLDARGDFGRERGPRLGNLVAAARAGRSSVYHRGAYTGVGAGASGGTGYVMGDGWSVTYGP